MSARGLLVGALLLACVLGCKKPSGQAFYDFSAKFEVLLAREGDQAYVSDELSAILQGLESVPAEAAEKPQAQSLLARIDSERRRVQAEAAEARRLEEQAPPPAPPQYFAEARREEAPAAPARVDAGPAGDPELTGNLDVKALQAAYGSCLGAGVTGLIPDDTRTGTAFPVSADPTCRKRMKLPVGPEVTLFTADGKLLKATTVTTVQGPPVQVNVPRDAGAVIPANSTVTYPGAPTPQPTTGQ